MPAINVYCADRYVIAAGINGKKYKIFQIAFSSSDASLYVTFPYLEGCLGRLGAVKLPAGQESFEKLTIGEDFPVTSHLVKYSHHPSGQAHFSLTGKIKTSIKKQSVPLHAANGHIFTANFQGIHHFKALEDNKKATNKRGIVPFSFDEKEISSIKFVCHIYSDQELGRRVSHKLKSPWTLVHLPSGEKCIGIPLATPIHIDGQRRFLFITAQATGSTLTGKDKGISFMGGFDHDSTVFNHGLETEFLMMFVHESESFEELSLKFGSIDLQSAL
ncbi:hypothetical protein Pres01_07380 [Metapseudomonas resinovorans]|uniref:hypothetical protein n=1 Tax=Metapseudomonas resinovorans TaxID=53412 RepID=UPI00131B0BD5|nr:hypothetical protein [Pseudomonas resinovorans]GLZ84687.1 hypothetical protein Pres01_07380 [Pseudomonas resinovorans]